MGKAEKRRALAEKRPILEAVERFYWLFWGVLLLLAGFFVFFKLGHLPAMDWDEARHGVNAYEMLKSGNGLLNTYCYAPDYYNLKPPLSMWAIMAGYKLFGFNLFGLRFYSAASFLLLAVLASLFCKMRYGKLESLLALFLLCFCQVFYVFHFARNGDADSLFVLLATASVLAALLANEKPWFFPVCGFCCSLAFLAKSWHALAIPAIVGIYLFTSGLIRRLGWRRWAVFFLCAAGPIAIWAALRYSQDGMEFFRQMVNVDLLNRVSEPLEGHTGGPAYYLALLFQMSLFTGALFVCVGAFAILARVLHAPLLKRAGGGGGDDLCFYLLWIFIPILLFTIAQTKIKWYIFISIVPIIMLSAQLLAQTFRGPKKFQLARGLFLLLLVVFAVGDGVGGYRRIAATYDRINPTQAYMAESLPQLPQVRGVNAYWEISGVENPTTWRQGDVLLAELTADLKCQNGGIQAFLSDGESAVLLVADDVFAAHSAELANDPVLGEKDGLLCVFHAAP